MDPNTRSLVMGAAGGAGAEKLYVEDVFSTYLYTGNGSTQTITNGIDLSGKGGLVWVKQRSGIELHRLSDTLRGANSGLRSNSAAAENVNTTMLTAFNTDGFSLGSNTEVNGSGSTYTSWTFRKAAKFFDIVTYTGTGSAQNISHNLGSVPGCIIVKRLDAIANWFVYHRSTGAFNALSLNTTEAAFGNNNYWNNTSPTNSVFSLGIDARCNANGSTYVAYLFAHDAGGFGDSGNDNVISCGSYTGNGSTSGPVVNLGWEPQFVIIKLATGTSDFDWYALDSMRGIASGAQEARLSLNSSAAEVTGADYIDLRPTGFQVTGISGAVNQSGQTYIYIAIRRGPMKTPTAGTDVFYTELESQKDSRQSEGVPFPPDLVNTFSRNGTDRISGFNLFTFVDRLRGLGTPSNSFTASAPYLISSSTGAENSINQSFVQLKADGRNITSGVGWDSSLYGNFISYFFRRAPGFFDIVAYTGTGSPRTVAHNLGVAPELMIIKQRSTDNPWSVYYGDPTKYIKLNTTDQASTLSTYWNNTSPTSTVFTVGTKSDVNASGSTLIAYLFATVPGVSKVGSYTGTGAALDIDCGFTNGARFVLIKRTDSTGDWYVWDTARGIVSGNDPYLLINSNAAEVTSTDYIDPLSSGFQISSTAPAAINANGGSYIYLSVA